jgi:uncharacterized Tic20 family protein
MNNPIPLKVRLLAASFHVLNALFSHLSILIIWILWMCTRNIHPFVNLAGKNALNCAINSLIWFMVGLTLCFLLFSLTCGMGSEDPVPVMLGLAFTYFFTVTYSIYALVTGIYALTGSNFKSRLIYPFIQDE